MPRSLSISAVPTILAAVLGAPDAPEQGNSVPHHVRLWIAPGLRATNLNARAAASGGDPAEAAAGAVWLALLTDDGPTGEFFSWNGTSAPW